MILKHASGKSKGLRRFWLHLGPRQSVRLARVRFARFTLHRVGGSSSGVERLLRMHEVAGSIPSSSTYQGDFWTTMRRAALVLEVFSLFDFQAPLAIHAPLKIRIFMYSHYDQLL